MTQPKNAALNILHLHSGVAGAVDSRIILQVRLRCTHGSVRWTYPGQALRVALEPNLSSAQHSAVCIKPWPSLHGTNVFAERAGELELLPSSGNQVFCLKLDGPRWPAIYLQSSPPSDGAWSRHLIGFRYEVLSNRSAAPILGHRGLYGEMSSVMGTNEKFGRGVNNPEPALKNVKMHLYQA